MVVFTLIKSFNTNQKNMMIGCVYKHLQHKVNDFTKNHLLSLLD